MPCSSSSSRRSSSIQRFSSEYDGWWISSGVPSSRAIVAASRVFGGGVRRDAGVQRLALPDRVVERHHRLLDRGVGVEAVAVEDVDVLQAHPRQRLVERGEDVLPRAAALAVRAGPHVPAGLGGDDQLVAVGREVVLEVAPEVLLGATVGRAVVVGEVEVGHPAVERPAQDRALGLLGAVGPEVLPQPQGQDGQLEPAASGEAVLHPGGVGVVSVLGGCVAHGFTLPPPAARAKPVTDVRAIALAGSSSVDQRSRPARGSRRGSAGPPRCPGRPGRRAPSPRSGCRGRTGRRRRSPS